jgi:hypothetical protein
MIQDGTATGTVDFSTNTVTTTATDTIQLISLKTPRQAAAWTTHPLPGG